MHSGVLVTIVGVTGALFLYQFLKWKKLKQKKLHFLTATNKQSLSAELPQDEVWWASLDMAVQLELAVALAGKALPVWQKYSEANGLAYKNSLIGNSINISSDLLKKSLDAITESSAFHFPQYDKAISNCYNEFIAPLVALQDGHWTLAYPVKKIFLAVYNILKAIAEQEQIPVTKSLLTQSIHQSLDCLDMCKLFSREEIRSFLHSNKIEKAG